MQTAGIVSEYNPFHRGHARHLEATRRAGADFIVCVMSGDFVQRGEAAIMSRWARARAAVACGADLVLALPLTWALSPARRFAHGAVYLLEALGCIDTLSFGSECGDASLIKNAALVLSSTKTQAVLREHIKQGKSYAAAAEAALRSAAPDCAGILTAANDTLGVEYLSALERLGSSVRPFTVRREEGGLGYRAEELRRELRNGADIAACLPEASADIFRAEAAGGRVLTEPCEAAVLSRLCSMRTEEFAALPEVREGLENRLYAAARNALSLEDFFAGAKTRRFTRASLKRIAMDALLGIRAEDWHETPGYLHVLAMGERAPEILRRAKKTASLPIIHSAGQVRKLEDRAQQAFALERRAEEIWRILAQGGA